MKSYVGDLAALLDLTLKYTKAILGISFNVRTFICTPEAIARKEHNYLWERIWSYMC